VTWTRQQAGAQGATANTSTHSSLPAARTFLQTGRQRPHPGQDQQADGASLGLTFKSKTGEAHVAKTILTIPPPRLTTIQKACVATTFESEPGELSARLGHRHRHGAHPRAQSAAHRPDLPGPHGSAAWPDAELVLQGEPISVILDGKTAIKKGVTTSSFLSVPDAPFESVEATLPEGPHSALTTNLPLKDHYSLCGQYLTIPTQLGGQKTVTAVNESVNVAVQGCRAVKASKARRLTPKQKLGRALTACRKRHRHSSAQRASCMRRACRRYPSKSRSFEAASAHDLKA